MMCWVARGTNKNGLELPTLQIHGSSLLLFNLTILARFKRCQKAGSDFWGHPKTVRLGQTRLIEVQCTKTPKVAQGSCSEKKPCNFFQIGR